MAEAQMRGFPITIYSVIYLHAPTSLLAYYLCQSVQSGRNWRKRGRRRRGREQNDVGPRRHEHEDEHAGLRGSQLTRVRCGYKVTIAASSSPARAALHSRNGTPGRKAD